MIYMLFSVIKQVLVGEEFTIVVGEKLAKMLDKKLAEHRSNQGRSLVNFPCDYWYVFHKSYAGS